MDSLRVSLGELAKCASKVPTMSRRPIGGAVTYAGEIVYVKADSQPLSGLTAARWESPD